LDIHSGGIDLRFPHHDNELAQTEAMCDKPQWVNYFLHSGHLFIQGSKMSKSLKNFITISEVLKNYSSRELRLLFLMSRWDGPMEYSPDGESIAQAVSTDKTFKNFFGLVKATLRKPSSASHRWAKREATLEDLFVRVSNEVHFALCDNFNTPEVIVALRGLVSETNGYINSSSASSLRAPLVQRVASYVFRMLKVFGLSNGNEFDYATETETFDESSFAPIVDCLSNFRTEIRTAAQQLLRQSKSGSVEGVQAAAQSLLVSCDSLRDDKLVELGFQMEDGPDGTIWKRSSKEEIMRDRQMKREEEERRLAEKFQRARLQAEQQAKKDLEDATPPSEYFRTFQGDQYLTYDDEGVPLTCKDGTEVSKSRRDKAKKFLAKHTLAYEAWKARTSHQNGSL